MRAAGLVVASWVGLTLFVMVGTVALLYVASRCWRAYRTARRELLSWYRVRCFRRMRRALFARRFAREFDEATRRVMERWPEGPPR